MKRITKLSMRALLIAGVITFAGAAAFAFTTGDGKVKVKITKIVDGDTTVIEKEIKESELMNLSSMFKDSKGKNVQVYVSAVSEDKNKSKKKNAKAYCYSFNTDSLFGNMSIKMDSLMKSMNMNFRFDLDSVLPNGMNGFKFDNDDEGGSADVVIINDGKETHISSNGKTIVKKIEKENGDGKDKNVTVIVSGDGKNKKKVIITTSVRVEEDKSPVNKENKEDLRISNFNFYPNPSDGKFNLEFEAESKEPATVTILDVNGREIYREVFSGDKNYKKEIDLGSKTKGTYILNLLQGKRSISRKIVIE